MSRQKKGEEGQPLLVEKTPKELEKMVGANTKVKVSRVCLQGIVAEAARKKVADEMRPRGKRR